MVLKRTRSQGALIHIIEARFTRAKSEDLPIMSLTADFCAFLGIRFLCFDDFFVCDLEVGKLGLLLLLRVADFLLWTLLGW